jgi:hypothetical protein
MMDNFRYWLITEITNDIVRNLNNWVTDHKEELPFHNIFKPDELRTIIPFSIDPMALSILDKIEKSGLTINFKTGTVGKDKKQVRLGKYILNKISQFTDKEKEWWNHRGNPTSDLKITQDTSEYAIIVSRSPIDIVRMSDHDGWSSCHGPGREYFQCAISDAKGAGAIAYVVKKEDLAKINLQSPEIFKDTARRLNGVTPISRIRLRKFVHKKDEYDLAIPEDRAYGKQLPGLEDSVRNWALKIQQNKLQGKRPRMKEFLLMGGSYQDNQAGDLFNNFFGDDLDSGDAEYGGEEENYENMADQMQREVDAISRQYRNKFDICSFYASVEEADGQPYVYYSGSVHLEIPEHLLTAHQSTHLLRNKIREWARKQGIDAGEVEIDGGDVRIDIDDESRNDDPDSFRSFLEDDLTDIDKQKDELLAGLYHLFIELGLAKANKVYSIDKDWKERSYQFQNFILEGEEPAAMVSLKSPIVLSQQKTGFPFNPEDQKQFTKNEQFERLVMKELNNWADKVFAATKQQQFLFQGLQHSRPFSSEFKIKPEIIVNQKLKIEGDQYVSRIIMNMHLSFEPFTDDEDVEDAFKFIEFLDKNYPQFVALINRIFLTINT